jgi:hypothetical protein
MAMFGSGLDDSPRGMGGRHTLGSSPESQEPVGQVPAPAFPASEPAEELLEPLHTIYLPWWTDARRRAQRLDPPLRAMFTRALDHVEAGWAHVAPLQRWYEAHRDRARDGSDYAHLLNFIDGDLVDLFRELAVGVAALVPGYDGWEADADPGGVDGELDRFERYFAVFRRAAEAIDAPATLGDAVRAAAQGLASWATELAVLVRAIDEAIIVPLYRRNRDDSG